MTPGVVPDGANVLMVRHGQSAWNAIGRWQGQADPPLSDIGRRQAAAAGEVVAGWALDAHVTSSDLARARDTGAAIASGASLDPVATDPAFRERHAGDWQGMTRAEIEEAYPGWIDDGRRPNGWEHDDRLVDRAVPALQELVERRSRSVLIVVSHGGLIRSLERAAVNGAPPPDRFRRLANLEGTWLRIGPDGVEADAGRVHLLPESMTETFGAEA